MIKLYSYFRSSASFRVRIALNLKAVDFKTMPVHLTRGGGEQFGAEFKALNPASLLPVLEDGEGLTRRLLTQSMAIIEYLEETHPLPPLLPSNAADRARVRAIALSIACDIHPLNNLRVLGYLKKNLGLSDEVKEVWYRHWVDVGLAALETQLAGDSRTRSFCHGDSAGMADVFLIPQIFNARRFNCDLSGLPTIMRIFDSCMTLPAFAAAAPAQQPDAE